jgi:hypothetical protein
MAAPSPAAVGANFDGTTAAPAIAAPSGVVANSLVVVCMFLDGAAKTVTPPAGWAAVENTPVNVTGGSHGMHVFWHRAAGSESGPYTFTWTGDTYCDGFAIRFTDVVTTGTPFDSPTGAAESNDFGTNISPAVSTTSLGPDRCDLWVSTNWSGGAWTPPAGYTEQRESTAQILTAATLAHPVQGSTGSVTGTCASSDRRTAFIGAIIGTTAASAPAAGMSPIAFHPGKGPLARARFYKTPRSTSLAASVAGHGLASIGLSATSTAAKVAVVSGVCSMGLGTTTTASKIAPAVGVTTLGVAAVATAKKIATTAGVSTIGVAGAGTARKVAPTSATAPLGLAVTGTAQKTAVSTAAATLGLAVQGTAAKKAAQAGVTTLALDGYYSAAIVRALSGVCSVGMVGTSLSRKVAATTGGALLGLAAAGSARKTGVTTGTVHIGMSLTVLESRLATVVAAGPIAVLGSGTAQKLARQSGLVVAAFGSFHNGGPTVAWPPTADPITVTARYTADAPTVTARYTADPPTVTP